MAVCFFRATANGSADADVVLPDAIGLWGKTNQAKIDSKTFRNVRKFHGPACGTFGAFTLTPMNSARFVDDGSELARE